MLFYTITIPPISCSKCRRMNGPEFSFLFLSDKRNSLDKHIPTKLYKPFIHAQ